MMNLEELKTILEATGFPVAYSHFLDGDIDPVPAPPFVVYLVTDSTNIFADNVVWKTIYTVQIELYTDKKDIDAEAKVEAVLTANEIAYQSSENYIQSEHLFQKIYEVGLI